MPYQRHQIFILRKIWVINNSKHAANITRWVFEWETAVYFCQLFVHFKTLLTTLTNSALFNYYSLQKEPFRLPCVSTGYFLFVFRYDSISSTNTCQLVSLFGRWYSKIFTQLELKILSSSRLCCPWVLQRFLCVTVHCANKGLFGPLKHASNQAFNRTIF